MVPMVRRTRLPAAAAAARVLRAAAHRLSAARTRPPPLPARRTGPMAGRCLFVLSFVDLSLPCHCLPLTFRYLSTALTLVGPSPHSTDRPPFPHRSLEVAFKEPSKLGVVFEHRPSKTHPDQDFLIVSSVGAGLQAAGFPEINPGMVQPPPPAALPAFTSLYNLLSSPPSLLYTLLPLDSAFCFLRRWSGSSTACRSTRW